MTLLRNVTQTGIPGTAQYQNKILAGAWIVRFQTQDFPRDMDFEIWHGAAIGPGGYFRVYIDQDLYGIGENGLYNEFSPNSAAMFIRKGQEVSLHWSIAAAPAPQVWFYLRTPEVGLLG